MEQARRVHARLPCPAIGQVFELATDKRISGFDVVRAFGHNPLREHFKGQRWRFNGYESTHSATLNRCRLVQIGACRGIDEVRRRLATLGKLLPGTRAIPFSNTFSQDALGPIGFADGSWVSPEGITLFPMIRANGRLRFDWVHGTFHQGWRWLVELG